MIPYVLYKMLIDSFWKPHAAVYSQENLKGNKNLKPWAFVSLPAVEKYRRPWISALLTEGELHMYCSISCAGLAITACSDYHLERNSLKQKSSRSLQKADERSIQTQVAQSQRAFGALYSEDSEESSEQTTTIQCNNKIVSGIWFV